MLLLPPLREVVLFLFSNIFSVLLLFPNRFYRFYIIESEMWPYNVIKAPVNLALTFDESIFEITKQNGITLQYLVWLHFVFPNLLENASGQRCGQEIGRQ